MKTALTGLAAAGAILSGGCVVAIGNGEPKDNYTVGFSNGDGWGTVYGADVHTDSLILTVSDNGCTTKDFFDVEVRREDDDEFEVGFVRTREDFCGESNPDGAALVWSFSELGVPAGADVTILNRVRR